MHIPVYVCVKSSNVQVFFLPPGEAVARWIGVEKGLTLARSLSYTNNTEIYIHSWAQLPIIR